MDINYELYKVFYYVASTLSFSEASKQLFISQSAVSQSIKALEKKLDQTLFIRSTKKVRLTTEGEILLRHIEPAISLIKRGESQLLDVGARGGQLHIGASDTICRYFLVPYLERFHREFPGAHIKVTNATSIRCVELLETGQVDLIVVNSPNSYLGNVPNVKKIKDFQDVFIANEAFKETPYYGTDIHALIDDIAKAYQDAILDFYDHGCRYLQIDDTSWTYLIDENFQKKITALGYTKGQILNWFQLVSTKALEHKPEDFFIATHFCKGNFKGNPLFHGFYDSVAPVIAEIPYDAFFVEYDDARSGSFAPWSVLKDKDAIFVAGLISTKNPILEDHDFLKKRYAEARSVVGEQIALSPQCGFASVEEGNCIDEETQWKKIDLLVSCQDFL